MVMGEDMVIVDGLITDGIMKEVVEVIEVDVRV